MMHFVLEDIDPVKAKNFALFLKEMNEISLLITVAGAPFVSDSALVVDEEKGASLLELEEDIYEVKFKGQSNNGEVTSGYFEVYEDKKRLLEISYSIKQGAAIALRAKLNCEGESLVREELERAFERDFSQEAHDYMETPLEEIRKPKLQISDLLDSVEDEAQPSLEEILGESNKPNVVGNPEPIIEQLEEEDSMEEITEELAELTQRVQEAIIDTRYMISMLNSLSHDITRGATINIEELELGSEKLENGALVEMLDDESNDYKITFRRGSLEDMVEVSFFLEKDDVLIFSVYFSSDGVGRISSSSNQSKIILKKVKNHLL